MKCKVFLVGNYASELQPSMRRYARGLLQGMRANGEVNVELVEGRRLAASIGGGRRRKILDLVGRNVVYPAALGRHPHVEVCHVIDQGNAPLHRRVEADVHVTTCHDLIPLLALEGELDGVHIPPVAEAQYRFALDALVSSRFVICDSESTRDDLVSRLDFPRDRTAVVYLGVESHFSPPDERYTNARPRITTVGAQVAYKNTERLLRACVLLCERGVDLELAIIGRGLSDAQREVVVGTALEPRLDLVGRVSEEQLVAEYQRADVFAFPSVYEGFGWPPLEALACGTPVVCSAAGSLRELAAPFARVVDPLSVEDIADGLREVLDDPDRWRARAAAGAVRCRDLTWEACAREVLTVYAALGVQLEAA